MAMILVLVLCIAVVISAVAAERSAPGTPSIPRGLSEPVRHRLLGRRPVVPLRMVPWRQ